MVLAANIGFGFYSVMQVYTGLFMVPVSDEFNWTKTELTAGLSLSSIIVTILSPLFGVLIDRWGSRRLVLPGLFLKALVFAGFSLISGSMVQWMAIWVIYALVTLCIKSTVWTTAIASTFNSGRGLAMGAMMTGAAVSQVIVAPLGNWLITEFGWRIGGSTFIIMTLTIALLVHQFPILVEAGVSREKAALLMSLGGVAGIFGKIITGHLMDKFKPNLIGGATLAMAAGAFLLLIDGVRTPVLITIALVINGYASGSKLQICGYLTARYAGLRHFGLIFSIMASLISLGAGLGPLLASICYDAFSSYNPFLIVGVIGSLLSGYLILRLGDYPQWEPMVPAADSGTRGAHG